MRYKTYKGKNPSGLIKTLFVARKEDFDSYFDVLSDKILSVQKNLVIYTYEDIAEVDDEFLSEMRLIISPITMAFLSPDCRERTEVFDRARKMNIPVLPILKERGIERFFNAACGEIQCLNAVDDDSTALSLEKKLSLFMDEILISEETTKRVREAFHAYIFLSYRKKDRKHAQEIMSLIHNNDFMRDVAIWYDEYLVAGENFNDSIRDALLKSRMVALVVTPNLVNEDNYVQQEEYPMAVEAGKKVLPIEAVPTDPDAMKEKYAGIDDAVNEEKAEALTEALRRIFDAEVMKQDDDPEHLFFIGLAYIMGIDVETDTIFGMELIKRSFFGGYIPAGHFLKSCYMEGRYVYPDYVFVRDIQEYICSRYYDRFWGDDATEEYGREEILEFVDILHKLVDLLIICDGYTEKALQYKTDELNFLEMMVGDYPIGPVEFRDPDDPDVSEIKEMFQDLLRIGAARREKLDIMINMPDHREDKEITEICTDIWDFMAFIQNKYHKYCIEWDIMRLALPFSKACRYFTDTDFHWFEKAMLVADSYQDIMDKLSDEGSGEQLQDTDMQDLMCSIIHLKIEWLSWLNETYDGSGDAFYSGYFEAVHSPEPDLFAALDENVHYVVGIYMDREQEYERDNFLQMYRKALCDLSYNRQDYGKAYDMICRAISELEDRYDTHPNLMLSQMNNYEKLIEIGEKLDDAGIQKRAYTGLIQTYEDYDEYTAGNVANAPDIWEHVRILKKKGIQLDINV